jgi:hypothetical protein
VTKARELLKLPNDEREKANQTNQSTIVEVNIPQIKAPSTIRSRRFLRLISRCRGGNHVGQVMRIVLILLGDLGQCLLVPIPARFEVEHDRVEERHSDDGK